MFDLPCGVRLRGFRADTKAAQAPAPGEHALSDSDNIVALFNDASMVSLFSKGFVVPTSPTMISRFLKSIEDKAEMFCIVESLPDTPSSSHTPQFLGFTGLWAQVDRGHRLAEFSIVLAAAAHNRGLGTAITKFMLERAFVHLNMHRVALGVRGDNLRAQSVYKKCGFIEEGRERKAYWIEGAWRDYLSMGILLEEWHTLRDKTI